MAEPDLLKVISELAENLDGVRRLVADQAERAINRDAAVMTAMVNLVRMLSEANAVDPKELMRLMDEAAESYDKEGFATAAHWSRMLVGAMTEQMGGVAR